MRLAGDSWKEGKKSISAICSHSEVLYLRRHDAVPHEQSAATVYGALTRAQKVPTSPAALEQPELPDIPPFSAFQGQGGRRAEVPTAARGPTTPFPPFLAPRCKNGAGRSLNG